MLAGFLFMLFLLLLQTANSVRSMQDLQERMRDIVEQRNLKIKLTTDLLEASHNRHDALVYQVVTEDPFARDDNFQRFIKWGYNVGKARNDLRDLPLDRVEQQNMAEQDALIRDISKLHDAISDLASHDRLDEARALMAEALRPLNLQFMDLIDRLRQYERDQIQASLEATRQATHDAKTLSIGLGGVLVALAGLIAMLTLRAFQRNSKVICEQMEALEHAGVQLQHEASHDALTGLANRSLFYQRLMHAIEHARGEEMGVTVFYVDLDHFKPVNDQYGHSTGDSLLQIITARLLESVRTTDTVARLGGDEFALVLLGVGGAEQIEKLRCSIESAVARPATIGDITLHPSCSIGHAIFPKDGDSMDALLHTADTRMYEIKRGRSLR